MDSLTSFLKATRMRIKSISSWTIWHFKCANPILEYLHITTSFNNYVCYIALTTLKAQDTCLWYLGSGCSKHMTGNKALFKTLFERKIGTITFGDGSKSIIRVIGTIDIPGLPVFEDVWVMVNLLSISQICDNGLNVLFTKYECEILDDGGNCICVEIRIADNCYSITLTINHKCHSVKINQVDLWHQWLGHASHKSPSVRMFSGNQSLKR